MNDILSKISGQFDRSMIFGTLLPSFLFTVAVRVWITPRLPATWTPLRALGSLSTEWEIAAWAMVTIVIAGGLFSVNSYLFQLYQGSFWKKTILGRWRCRRYRKELEGSIARRLALRFLLRKLPKTDPRREALVEYQRELSLVINNEFPKPESVLPTRFGNAMKSVTSYPSERYKISGATFYPRLAAVVDSDYAAKIEDSKRELDFMLNTSFLSTCLALLLLATSGFPPCSWSSPSLAATRAAGMILCLLLSLLLYRAAVDRALVWGVKVRGAFDLYRWKLLELMGYRQPPKTLAEERSLWGLISLFTIHGSPPHGTDMKELGKYDPSDPPPPSPVRVEGQGGQLELSRGVVPWPGAAPRPGLEVHLRIRNAGADAAADVVAIDTVPEGFEYFWDSARLGGKPAKLSGVNPYRFEIGQLGAGKDATIHYVIIPRAPFEPTPARREQPA